MGVKRRARRLVKSGHPGADDNLNIGTGAYGASAVGDVFLSYAREDKETAHRLADAIEARGFSVWWDAEIPPGKTWDQMIEQELAAAHCAVVLWSKTSVRKTWVRAEANEALKRGILIPALIDAVEPPIAFRLTQAASLAGWRGEDDHPGFQQLLGAVERLVRDPSVEPQAALQAASIDRRPPPEPPDQRCRGAYVYRVAVGLCAVAPAATGGRGGCGGCRQRRVRRVLLVCSGTKVEEPAMGASAVDWTPACGHPLNKAAYPGSIRSHRNVT